MPIRVYDIRIQKSVFIAQRLRNEIVKTDQLLGPLFSPNSPHSALHSPIRRASNYDLSTTTATGYWLRVAGQLPAEAEERDPFHLRCV